MVEVRFKVILVYLFVLVAPFFMFAIAADKDSLPMWMMGLLILVFLYDFLLRDGQFWIDRSFLFVFLWVMAYGFSTILVLLDDFPLSWLSRGAVSRAATIDLRILYVACVFFFMVNILGDFDRKTLKRIFTLQIVIGLLLAAFGILQSVTVNVFGSKAITTIQPTNTTYLLGSGFSKIVQGVKYYRATGVFGEPSFFAFFLVPLFVKVLVATNERLYLFQRRMVNYLSLGILLAALFANFALTGLFSVVVILLLYSFSLNRAFWFKLILPTLVLFSAIVVFTPIGSILIARMVNIFELRDLSVLDRAHRVLIGIEVFVKDALFGVGPGGYAFYYPRLGGIDLSIMATPLNIWLSILTDVGVVGFLPFLALLVHLLRRGTRAGAAEPLARVYLWSVVSLLVLLTSLDFWYGEIFWFELALLAVLSRGMVGARLSDLKAAHPSFSTS